MAGDITFRSSRHSAAYDATSAVKLGGFTGVQFDGQIVWPKNRDHTGYYFIPFSPPSHAAKTRMSTRSTATSSGSSP
jgi:hypothetical protein